jgi:hypothetical protein
VISINVKLVYCWDPSLVTGGPYLATERSSPCNRVTFLATERFKFFATDRSIPLPRNMKVADYISLIPAFGQIFDVLSKF